MKSEKIDELRNEIQKVASQHGVKNWSVCERIKIFLTGQLWLKVMTFNRPLQPQLPIV
jgi:hypothetical protein